MKQKFSLLLLLLLLASSTLQAARVDTLAVQSASMKKQVPVIVVLPTTLPAGTHYPTLYLLHGYGGNETSWLKIHPDLPQIADRDGMAFVCPGVGNSWYMDSPVKKESRYETFMITELLPYLEGLYPLLGERRGRAITGLSMGGYGAMTLAMKHKDLFGAAGSTSGGLDIRPFPNNWELSQLLGAEYAEQERWDAYTPINMIPRLKNGDLSLIIDCGYADFFLGINCDFHEKLLAYGIMHDFYLRPGGHTAAYWANSLPYQLLFFRNFFATPKS